MTIGTPQIVDLDKDGNSGLIASSAGSMPSYVDIYRWNGLSSEKAEVAKQTGNEYVLLNNKIIDNVDAWISETSISQGEKHFYRYQEGKLIEDSSL